MRKVRDIKLNSPILLAVAGLITLLFLTGLIGISYAIFYSSANEHGDAKVAEFNITQTGTVFDKTIEVKVTPGENKKEDYTVVINNKSEVAVEYTLKVTNVTGNLPLKFTLAPKEESGNTAPAMTTKHENGVSISSARREPGDYTDTYILNIIWDNTDPENNLAYIGMVDYITLSVTATQVQTTA